MELSFANIAFVLFVRIANVSTFFSGLDIRLLDAENLHTIREEQAIVEHLEFASLNLLNVRIELIAIPIWKSDQALFGCCFFDTLHNCFFRYLPFGLFHYGGELDFDSTSTLLIK